MNHLSENIGTFDPVDSDTNRFDILIEILLAVLFVFMPLAMGARSAWTEHVVITLSAAIAICFFAKLIFFPSQRFIWTWAFLPITLFLLLVVFQIIEIPVGLMNIISPSTVELRTELLTGMIADQPETPESSIPLSFSVNLTKHDLRLLLSLTAVFVVVLNTFRKPRQIQRFLKTIALIGCGIAIFTLIQNIFGNGKVYWFLAGGHGGYSGPFINHNHYGQFMNLSIGAIIAYLFTKLHADFSDGQITLSSIAQKLRFSSAKPVWFLIIAMSIGALTVFISLTRGGVISMIAALIFTAFMLAGRSSLKGLGWVIFIAVFLTFSGITFISFDAICDRLETLETFDGYKWRWETMKDLIDSYKLFPLLGTGMGTHSLVFPMFQTVNTNRIFTHVENEYAQVIEEVGLIGLFLLIVFAVIVWTAYARSVKKDNIPVCSSAYGLGFGLLAVTIHSFSDYGQHIPANAFLSVTFCAILIGLSKFTTRQHCPESSHGSRILRSMAFVMVCVIFTWLFVSSNNARIAESNWKKALVIEDRLLDIEWLGTDAQYSEIIDLASAAVARQDQNPEYRYWLNVYKWYDINRRVDPDTNAVPTELMPRVDAVVKEFYRIAKLCPTFGPSFTTLGQIQRFAFKDETRGIRNLRKGYRLASCDPVTCLSAAMLDIEQNQIDDSIEKLQKAVELDAKLFNNVADLLIDKLNRPELAVSIAADHTHRLSWIARKLESSGNHEEMVRDLNLKLIASYMQKCESPDASEYDFVSLANLCKKQDQNELAIRYYKKALDINYGHLRLRLTLARLLKDEGNIQEAMKQARMCLRLNPDYEPAVKMVKELSVHPEILEKTE